MSVLGRPIRIVALLLAAAAFALFMLWRGPGPAGPDASARAGAPFPAAPTLAAETVPLPPSGADARLQEQLDILRQGMAAQLAAGGRAAVPPRGRFSGRLAVLGAGLSGFALGAGLFRLRGLRRGPRAGAAAPAGSWPEAEASRDTDEDRRPGPAGDAIGSPVRAGLLPWSPDAREAPADEDLARRLRSLERTLLRCTQRLDALAEGASVRGPAERSGAAGGGFSGHSPVEARPEVEDPELEPRRLELPRAGPPEGDRPDDPTAMAAAGGEAPPESRREAGERDAAHVAGFAHALVRAGRGGPAESDATPDRVRQAIHRLSRDGWSHGRIARRLWLEPEVVSRVLREAERTAGARRARARAAR